MNRFFCCILVSLASLASVSYSQGAPALTVINQALESATVRVVGSTAGYLELPPGESRTTVVAGGVYRLIIRYCDSGGRCHYSKTDSFAVTQTAYSASRITITLRSVGGNLSENSSTASEFDRGQE